jgi:hypothetical protein
MLTHIYGKDSNVRYVNHHLKILTKNLMVL